MKNFLSKLGKTKIALISVAVIVLIAAVLLFIFIKPAKKSVQINKSEGYSKIIDKEDLNIADVEKSLSDYNVSEAEAENEKIFAKDDVTIHIKADKNGKVTYMSYKQELGSDVVSNIGSFNESMIKIGDKEEQVLSKLSKYNYIYNLKTTNEDGKPLHIYYYGWTSEKAILELVFTDGVLTYYTINSNEVAKEVSAPEVK